MTAIPIWRATLRLQKTKKKGILDEARAGGDEEDEEEMPSDNVDVKRPLQNIVTV